MKHTKIGRLKKHLEMIGHITKLEAAKYYYIYGLKEQINRLISRGMKIETVLTPNGKNSPYATYTVIK